MNESDSGKEQIMRQRHPNHEARLQNLLGLNSAEAIRQIEVADRKNPDFVESEVLASMIRARFGASTGVLSAATAALHRRAIEGTEARIRGNATWRAIERTNDLVVAYATSYFWEKFLDEKEPVCNAEAYFGVYLQNKVDDYMRQQLTEENTRLSVDAMSTIDEDGNKTDFIALIEDPNGESPEKAAMRAQLSRTLERIYLSLPYRERSAFYFRVECKYEWKMVAALLGCSIPTARDLVNRSLEKLQGELNDEPQ